MKSSVSIVVPAHNEEAGLGEHISKVQNLLKKRKIAAEIVLVNDNSTDNTGLVCGKLARKYKNVRVIHRKSDPGMGGALMLGTKHARGDIVVWLMGDISDDLNAIPKFIENIESGQDMVIASRYIKGGDPGNLQPMKKFFSKSFSVLSRILVGVPVHDVTYAYRAFRKNVASASKLESKNFAISPEFTLKAPAPPPAGMVPAVGFTP